MMDKVMTPEERRLASLKKGKVDHSGEYALQAVHERIEMTRLKPFAARSIAELIEFSHMSGPIEQFNIGIEFE